MPAAIAIAFVLAMAAGSRSGWRTQADVAEEERLAAEKRAKAQSGAPPPPAVQGLSTGRRWFYWFIHYGALVVEYGPKYMTDNEAFMAEFSAKTNYLGASMHRYVWIRDERGGTWVRDTRSDPDFLAGAPVQSQLPQRRVVTDSRQSSSSVGAVPTPGGPVRGEWPWRGLPNEVRLAGRVFERAKFSLPYPGVIAQYREAKARDSAHLFVLDTGRFVVPHIDDANPDRGLMMEHAMRDMLPSLLPRV
jgi:hypothetical protein